MQDTECSNDDVPPSRTGWQSSLEVLGKGVKGTMGLRRGRLRGLDRRFGSIQDLSGSTGQIGWIWQ